MTTRLSRAVLGLMALGLLWLAPVAQAGRNDVIVVPARARMVRLGFDLQALRGAALVSYRETDEPLQPLLHVWNRSRREWQQVDVARLTQQSQVPSHPNVVYIIGLPNMIPETLAAALSGATEVRTLNTFSVAEILTAVDREMRFSVAEWQMLGERYNLDVTEINAEQRRWGRFGPPRRYRQDPTPEPGFEPLDTFMPSTIDAPRQQFTFEVPQAAATVMEPQAEPEPVTRPVPVFEQPAAYEETIDPVIPKPRMPEPEKGTDKTPTSATPVMLEEEFPIK
jgi:hypothetical protein